MTAEEILAALQAIIDGAADRALTDDEVERCEALEGQLKAVQRTQELRGRMAAYNTPVPVRGAVAVLEEEDPQERAFEQYLRTGHVGPEMLELRAQSEGTNSAGGYLVPTTLRNKIIERMKAFGGIAAAAETLTTSEGGPINYPTVDDTANVGEIVAEGGTFAAGADIVFGVRTLTAYKYMAGGAGNLPLKVSWELLQDAAFDIKGFVEKKLGERIARIQAQHFATGTGVGQPQGLVTPITTSGTIGTIGYTDLLATTLFLDPAYRANAQWVMNDATFGTIMGLVDTTGRPLVNQSFDSISGKIGQQTLLGYPVIIDQGMPNKAAAAKFLAFGDISEAYVVRRVKDITLVVLNELYAANGQTGFMAWARADGAVQNPNAVVVRTGA